MASGTEAQFRQAVLVLTSQQRHELYDKREGLFKKDNYHARIDTGDSPPVNAPSRRYGQGQRDELAKHVQELEAAGVIRPSSSDWSAAIVLVAKPGGGVRVCTDYRQLNKACIGISYQIPRQVKMVHLN
jgi:hypothetical protein